jgi:hypothetical protein
MTNTPEPTTYHQLSQIDVEAESSHGRFASPRPYYIGAEPAMAGAPIPAPAFRTDASGVEPALGISIEAVEDTTFVAHGGLANVAACPYALPDGTCHLTTYNIGPCLCGGPR